MSENDDTVKRHEDHFTKIFDIIDDIRNNYVRSPTFVISLITIVLIVASSAGWFGSVIFSNIDKNEQSIVDMAIKQGRILERQDSLAREQEKTITQLIEALKEHRGGP